ncbi:hypothetical protein [Bifidobacterium longum]|nr:hypothetical protein [Bifidobacterium longum]
MPGVTIGDNCIIGCGTIVTHDIPITPEILRKLVEGLR